MTLAEALSNLWSWPFQSSWRSWLAWLPISLVVTGMLLYTSSQNIDGDPLSWPDAIMAALIGGLTPCLLIIKARTHSAVHHLRVAAKDDDDATLIVTQATKLVEADGRAQMTWVAAFFLAHSIVLPFTYWAATIGSPPTLWLLDAGRVALVSMALLLLAIALAVGLVTQLEADRAAQRARAYVFAACRDTVLGDSFAQVHGRASFRLLRPLWTAVQFYVILFWFVAGGIGIAAVVVRSIVGGA